MKPRQEESPPSMVPPSASASAPTSRRRGGRPALPEDERRGQFIGFWVTPAELAQLEADAQSAAASSISAYIRAATFGRPGVPARRRRGSDIGPVVGQLARLGNNVNQLLREARIGHFPPATAAAIYEAARELAAYLRKLAGDEDGPET